MEALEHPEVNAVYLITEKVPINSRKILHTKTCLFCGVLMLVTACVQAQDTHDELEYIRYLNSMFELYTACAPVHLVVEDVPPDAAKIGLTRDQISLTVRSRLRGARIYDRVEGEPHLYVNVNVVGVSFSYSVELKQSLINPEQGIDGIASTWNTGGLGTHGGSLGYILQVIGQATDRFIDEYLEINESDCK